MSFSECVKKFDQLKSFYRSQNYSTALELFWELKNILIDFDSLPPLCIDTENALQERILARDVYEYSVLVCLHTNQREQFLKSIQYLRSFKSSASGVPPSELSSIIIGLNLLYLIVESKLSEFHSELELLTDEQISHPAIAFCTELDQHLMVGSYDQVLDAALRPPYPEYSFLLQSLQTTVRMNIGECVAASFASLSVLSAQHLFLLSSAEETVAFVDQYYPQWQLVNNMFQIRVNNQSKAESIPSMKLITQALSYATELERIV